MVTDRRRRLWGFLKRTLNATTILLVLVVVAVFAAIAVPQLVGAERSYVVLSGSMAPTMEPGDVILVDAVSAEAVEAGQIVTFEEDAGVTTHRVLEVVEDGQLTALRTKGDANPEPDPGLVSNEDLVGRVMSVGGTPIVIPYVGQAVEAARTRLGVYALVLIPFTLFVLNEVYTRLGRSRSGRRSGRSRRSRREPLAAAHAIAEGVSTGGRPTDRSTTRRSRSRRSQRTTAPVDGLDPRVFRITPVVLLVLAVYGGWTAVRHGSAIAATIAAGSGVALLLLGAVRLQIRLRGGDVPPPPAGLVTADVTVALVALVLVLPFAGWFTLQHESVPSGMLAAGGAVTVVLLAHVRLRLWWVDRTAATGPRPSTGGGGVSDQ